MKEILKEILIYLEDRGESPLRELGKFGKRKASGSLARMEREGWVKKRKEERELLYEITEEGRLELNRILETLHQERAWDGSWFLVLVSFPENKKAYRSGLRDGFLKLGLGLLQNGVWLYPFDISKEVNRLASKFGLEDNILVTKIKTNAQIENRTKTIWPLRKINQRYLNFINKKDLLHETDRFRLKKEIYSFAQTLQNDPQLPEVLLPKDWGKDQAFSFYKKLREKLT